MKFKNAMLVRGARLMLVLGFIFSLQHARADQSSDDNGCWMTFTQQNNTCSTAQMRADSGYFATLLGKLAFDLADEQQTVQNDYVTYTNSWGDCNMTLWGFIGNPNIVHDWGTCGRTKWTQNALALAAFQNAGANCANNTNPKACMCPYSAAYKFAQAQNAATATKCKADAQNQHDNSCVPVAQAVQAQADQDASANQGLADAKARADYSHDTTLEDGYTTPLCESTASTTYNNCVNSVDCKYNPSNCCQDNAANAFNSAILSAYSGWIAAVGPADAQYQHDYPLCSAQQSHDDTVAIDLCNNKVSNANSVATTAIAAAGNAYTYTQAMDQATYTQAAANCVCNNPNDQTKQNDCTAAARQVQIDDDGAALVIYYSVANWPPADPVGSAYATWFTSNQSATNTETATFQKDLNTYQGCQTKAIAVFNTVYNRATVIYNNECAAAQDAYDSACTGGG